MRKRPIDTCTVPWLCPRCSDCRGGHHDPAYQFVPVVVPLSAHHKLFVRIRTLPSRLTTRGHAGHVRPILLAHEIKRNLPPSLSSLVFRDGHNTRQDPVHHSLGSSGHDAAADELPGCEDQKNTRRSLHSRGLLSDTRTMILFRSATSAWGDRRGHGNVSLNVDCPTDLRLRRSTEGVTNNCHRPPAGGGL